MTFARTGQAAVRLADGRLLIMGGTVPLAGKCGMACVLPDTSSVEIYDPKTGKFSHSGSLAGPVSNAKALLLNDGRVLVSGGWSSAHGDSYTFEIYDPAQRRSVVLKPPADMQALPADPTVVLLSDGKVLIAGGLWYGDNSTSNRTLVFDPASGGFSNGPQMAERRQGATATVLEDGRVLIVGGDKYDGGNGTPNFNAELIDLSRPLSKPAVLDTQHAATSTLLSDGRVLVAGGGIFHGAAGCATPVAPEVFDPRAEKFTPVGPMSTPASGSTAIGLQDSRVLLFGGTDSSCGAVGTVEAFDPDSGTFQVIASGFPTIPGFSATLLDDGRILVSGGWGESGIAAASWWLKP